MTELFTEEQVTPWKAEWQNMPEYSHEDLMPKFQVLVSFTCESDLVEFCKLIGQNIPASASRQTKSVWFPEQGESSYANKRYIRKL